MKSPFCGYGVWLRGDVELCCDCCFKHSESCAALDVVYCGWTEGFSGASVCAGVLSRLCTGQQVPTLARVLVVLKQDVYWAYVCLHYGCCSYKHLLLLQILPSQMLNILCTARDRRGNHCVHRQACLHSVGGLWCWKHKQM